MSMSGGKDDGEPMMEINTTPLIDVMLVLLIMFIITIPVATHSVNIDLPAPVDNPPPVTIDPVRNKVIITKDNKVFWNELELDTDGRELVRLLLDSAAMKPEPELQFMPDPYARYELTAKVLTIIKGSGVTKFGFVDNQLYQAFGKAPNAQ